MWLCFVFWFFFNLVLVLLFNFNLVMWVCVDFWFCSIFCFWFVFVLDLYLFLLDLFSIVFSVQFVLLGIDLFLLFSLGVYWSVQDEILILFWMLVWLVLICRWKFELKLKMICLCMFIGCSLECSRLVFLMLVWLILIYRWKFWAGVEDLYLFFVICSHYFVAMFVYCSFAFRTYFDLLCSSWWSSLYSLSTSTR